MLEPISTAAAITLLVKSSSSWLPAISDALIPPVRDAFIGKLTERAIDKGFEIGRNRLGRDEKEQARHLELALKNAAERGLAQFQTPKEQQQYNEVISVLSTSHAEVLRREALRLFTLNEESDFKKLATLFDQARAQAQPAQVQTIDAAPYLSSFFESLRAELYADPYFRQQMSDVLQVRTGLSMQRSLTEVLSTLNRIGETLVDNYTPEQFEKDVQAYIGHIERTLRYLKLVGVVPKERTNENRDPDLDGIFVPLRIAMQGYVLLRVGASDSLVDLLEQNSCMVLLGSPGSGKSTATRHLAWSHAVANLSNSTSLTNAPLLSGKPLPLRIELRRLNEDRRQRPDYDFLTYSSEVLLGRAGLNILPQMFELLLERRAMLVLFDGLDEVATLDDRRTLVEEIDSFAQQYPGNRFLVTSRPVGYNLASLSTQTFCEAQVQPFDDGQIHQFLENWYAHVLRLSPLSPDDRQELEELHTNLKNNPRLQALAENPLLLTVITALHRYERLPDKRILVYDRCADLLLETWARLKGTNARWQDLQLSKEDQYACVAHLGFVLHKRSQQESNTNGTQSNGGLANDVSSRFMLREIERFLQHQNLFPSIAEQNRQASRFLELIKEEAGLIVERGTGENSESLYGFVHRTFQEYFAAANVYERYQQEEDANVISDFLRVHLHDPHWSEVVLLLFGKLKRGPATKQLRQILDGRIKSNRSAFADLIQQDLFFVSDCMSEDITVESEFAEYVVSRLSDLIKNSPFPSQCEETFHYLDKLIHTKQYINLGQRELLILATQDNLMNIPVRIRAAQILYRASRIDSIEHSQAAQVLLALARRSDIGFEQSVTSAQTLYQVSLDGSDEEQQALQILLELANRSELSFEQTVEVARVLYQLNLKESDEQQQSTQLLLQLAQRSDLSFEQTIQVADVLSRSSYGEPERQQQAVYIFFQLAQRSDLSLEQIIRLAKVSRRFGITKSGDWELTQKILSLVQRPDILFEQAIEAVTTLYYIGFDGINEQSFAIWMLLNLVQNPNLSSDQINAMAKKLSLNQNHTLEITEREFIQLLDQIIQESRKNIEQKLLAATAMLLLRENNYISLERAIRIIISILDKEKAKQHIEKFWGVFYGQDADLSALPSMVYLAEQEILPIWIRDAIYVELRTMVPKFESSSAITI